MQASARALGKSAAAENKAVTTHVVNAHAQKLTDATTAFRDDFRDTPELQKWFQKLRDVTPSTWPGYKTLFNKTLREEHPV